MIALLVAAYLAAAGDAADALPGGPGRDLVQAACVVCHTADYLTQQRLTAAQWQRTIDKMRGFGAPLGDADVKVLAEYLARNWPADAPDRRPPPVKAPAAAVSGR